MLETRADRVIRFIHEYCLVPEGGKGKVGTPIRLLPFQEKFIREVYDNPAGTSRAYLSMPRKNGKTALIACLVLAHTIGPEKVPNSQIISGARSREQAGLVYKLAAKMVMLNPRLGGSVAHLKPSQKMITGIKANVEFHAISAEAGTAHGLSPVLAILDEVGQVKGETDDFVEAIETAQGAYDDALLIAISTQARTDADLFSRWLDDAAVSGDPNTVSHLYTAPAECDVMDRKAWFTANPALGEFRSLPELERYAVTAHRQPAKENSFRWLYLNQRIEAAAPYVSKGVWFACNGAVVPSFGDAPVYAGLDLSRVNDLTAFVAMANIDGDWHVKPTFWLPGDGLAEKARHDRQTYELWARQGYLQTTPGPTIDYRFLAAFLWRFCCENNVRRIAFDRWGYEYLKPLLTEVGFSRAQIDGDDAIFVPFGQGYVSMSPALNALEALLLEKRLRHGGHPVLTMCNANATVKIDEADNRKLDKKRSNGRIDGLVGLAMATSVAGTWEQEPVLDIMAMIA